MSHTPGPWRIAGDGDHEEIELCCVESATHDAIAIVSDAYTDHGDPLPNARLIAAAPELLVAARAVIENRGCGDPDCCADAIANEQAVQQLKAIVAKAEGR